jgi:hypothetical protein
MEPRLGQFVLCQPLIRVPVLFQPLLGVFVLLQLLLGQQPLNLKGFTLWDLYIYVLSY